MLKPLQFTVTLPTSRNISEGEKAALSVALYNMLQMGIEIGVQDIAPAPVVAQKEEHHVH